MSEIIRFTPGSMEDPDLDAMDREQLKEYLAELERQIEALDAREPRNMESEAYEAWADRHEELEDLLDEVQDLLDDMED